MSEPARGPEGAADPAVPLCAGDVLVGRYELLAPIGRGGHGEVWEARDALGGVSVAVKLFAADGPSSESDLRREIAALRLLNVPGVVRLLDEGLHGAVRFVVMDRIEGRGFPGTDVPAPWSEIAAIALALLESLARVHAAGILHRDLKPANVLVTVERAPVLLDFGLSAVAPLDGAALGDKSSGTPAYIAPEQVLGGEIGPWTDLYAFGVMLYEALSGALPHDAPTLDGLIKRRLAGPPTPIARLVPRLPRPVAATIDALLSPNPANRPRSASDAADALRSGRLSPNERPVVPWLGGDGVVQAILAAAAEGSSVDVLGEPGSGRTPALRAAAAELSARGRRVSWLSADPRPFGSLEAIVSIHESGDQGLAEVTARVERDIQRQLSEGAIVFADDFDRFDKRSQAALASLDAGTVVRSGVTLGASMAAPRRLWRMAPLGATDLRDLFVGPDRVFHLREDAAAALHERSAGVPGAVVHELEAWERAGLARRDGGRFRVERDAISTITTGGRVAPFMEGPAAPIPPHLVELLEWLEVGWPTTEERVLQAATRWPPWRVAAGVADLCELGAARIRADGRVEALRAPRTRAALARRQTMHRAFADALPGGSATRLRHALLAQAGTAVAEASARSVAGDALAAATALAEGGHLGGAAHLLGEVTAWLERAELPPEDRDALFGLWLLVALQEQRRHALDVLLYRLSRLAEPSAEVRHLEDLARAALGVHSGAGERALAVAAAVAPFEDARLEAARRGLIAFASRRCAEARQREITEEQCGWARAQPPGPAHAAASGWLARLRYREGRFDDAAALHFEGARGEPWRCAQLDHLLFAASALLEAFRLDEAAACARDALERARELRDPYREAKAEWSLRCAAYRTGATTGADLELVAAVELLDVPDQLALTQITEAAAAFRAGQLEQAIDLAERARRVWTGMDKTWPATLARCLAIACGSEPYPGEVAAIAERVEACTVAGLGAQALGLLALSQPGLGAYRDRFERLVAQVPAQHWDTRIDVASIAEARAWLGAVRD